MAAPLERPFRIDQDVGDVLDVANLSVAAAHLHQRIVGGARPVRRVEFQNRADTRAARRGQDPVLTLDVMDDERVRPGQQRRDHEPDALAAPGRCKAQHVLRSVMPQVAGGDTAKHDAAPRQQTRPADVAGPRPARRTVSGHVAALPRPPHRHGDGNDDRGGDAAGDDQRALQKDARRVGVEAEPPPEESEGRIDRQAAPERHRRAQLRLEAKAPGAPLRGRPDRRQHQQGHHRQLGPHHLGSGHVLSP